MIPDQNKPGTAGKPPIYILGAGGMAREVCFLIKSIGAFEIKGFVDLEEKEPVRMGKQLYKVFSEDFLEDLPASANLAMGVGNPAILFALSKKFAGRFAFPNLIHPSVIANFDDIEMGNGNIIAPNCVLTTAIRIGSFNIFNFSATVGHDAVIGNCNIINPGANISGGVEIADRNLLGVNCSVLQYKKIGSDCIVGANSFVNRDVESGTTVAGVPAKPIRR